MSFTKFKERLKALMGVKESVVVEEPILIMEESKPEELLSELVNENIPEEVVEAEEVETNMEEKVIYTEAELHKLSKAEVDEYALGHGITLDRRKSKSGMIKDFLAQTN